MMILINNYKMHSTCTSIPTSHVDGGPSTCSTACLKSPFTSLGDNPYCRLTFPRSLVQT